jgi:hypothetical protein
MPTGGGGIGITGGMGRRLPADIGGGRGGKDGVKVQAKYMQQRQAEHHALKQSVQDRVHALTTPALLRASLATLSAIESRKAAVAQQVILRRSRARSSVTAWAKRSQAGRGALSL